MSKEEQEHVLKNMKFLKLEIRPLNPGGTVPAFLEGLAEETIRSRLTDAGFALATKGAVTNFATIHVFYRESVSAVAYSGGGKGTVVDCHISMQHTNIGAVLTDFFTVSTAPVVVVKPGEANPLHQDAVVRFKWEFRRRDFWLKVRALHGFGPEPNVFE